MLRKTGLTLAATLLTGVATAQDTPKLFLVGTEPVNADMSYVELAWLPKVQAIAPGLTGVLEQDFRITEALETCAEDEDFPLIVARTENTFGGFAIEVGFEPAQNAEFASFLECALHDVQALEPDVELFDQIQQTFYENVDFLGYVLSLMTEFGYGLAREEFANPVPRPSEVFSLTLQDYRGVWPSLFDTSDLYATVVSPEGVADLLVAIDTLIDKDYGRPDQAVLPEQPPYTAAPLEGLGLKMQQGFDRAFFQINRVFAPSLVGSLAEGRVFDFVINQRLDAFRLAQGLEPSEDVFLPVEEDAPQLEQPEPRISGLLGLRPSFFADKQHIAAFTFLGIYEGAQPMAPTVDTLVAAIETAMAKPFTQGEFEAALADLETDYCAPEPVEGLAQIYSTWLREDLFHGRATDFIATNVLGCTELSLERANVVRDQAARNSATLVYGVGALIEDAQTLDRPFCIVDDITQLEFVCSQSEFQL